MTTQDFTSFQDCAGNRHSALCPPVTHPHEATSEKQVRFDKAPQSHTSWHTLDSDKPQTNNLPVDEPLPTSTEETELEPTLHQPAEKYLPMLGTMLAESPRQLFWSSSWRHPLSNQRFQYFFQRNSLLSQKYH